MGSYAGEEVDVPAPVAAHSLSGEARPEDGGTAVKPLRKKSLTRALRSYDPGMPEEKADEEPARDIFGVEKEQGIRYDEKDTRKGHSATGFEKTKEDFVDPKSVMTK